MRAIVIGSPGGEEVLELGEAPRPELGPGTLRVEVVATAVNRADLLQRQGKYPPPPGASPILGLECAGIVRAAAPGVSGFRVGDRVMALLAGGGYAEEVVVPAGCVMPVPEAFSWDEAAAFPETFLTVFLAVFELGALPAGGTALVHGGGSGVGTAAISLVRAAGCRVVVTAGSAEKCRRCLELGADGAADYRREDFVAVVRDVTGGAGADVVVDPVGAPYLARNLDALAVGGRLVLIATMGGGEAAIDLRRLLTRRLTVVGSTLRSRPLAAKEALVTAFLGRFGAKLQAGELRPVIDSVLPLERAADAHRRMAASAHFGKIVLRVR